jgi:hypothetical protein
MPSCRVAGAGGCSGDRAVAGRAATAGLGTSNIDVRERGHRGRADAVESAHLTSSEVPRAGPRQVAPTA